MDQSNWGILPEAQIPDAELHWDRIHSLRSFSFTNLLTVVEMEKPTENDLKKK